MVDEILVDPIVKIEADKARNSKVASLVSVQLIANSTNANIQNLIELVSKRHRGH